MLMTSYRLELCDENYEISDVDKATDLFEELKSTLNNYSFDWRPDCTTKLMFSLKLDSFKSLRRSMLSNFIKSLSHNVPSEYLRERGTIISNIAAELFLASNKIPTELISDELNTERYEQISLPIHDSSPKKKHTGKDRAQSVATHVSSPAPKTEELNSDGIGSDTMPIITKYVRFSKPLPRRNNTTARQLIHWQLGVDPDEYDYLGTAQAERDQQRLAEMSEAERLRVQARKAQYEKQQARQSQIFSQLSQRMRTDDTLALGSQPEMLGTQGPANSQALLKSALRGPSQRDPQVMESQATVGASSQLEEPSSTAKSTRKKKRVKGF
jgi:RNA polymerase I specific transcription initiation factor RRN6